MWTGRNKEQQEKKICGQFGTGSALEKNISKIRSRKVDSSKVRAGGRGMGSVFWGCWWG